MDEVVWGALRNFRLRFDCEIEPTTIRMLFDWILIERIVPANPRALSAVKTRRKVWENSRAFADDA